RPAARRARRAGPPGRVFCLLRAQGGHGPFGDRGRVRRVGRLQRGPRLPDAGPQQPARHRRPVRGRAGPVAHGHHPVLPRRAGRAPGHPLAPRDPPGPPAAMSPTTVVRAGHVLTMGPAGDLAGGAVAFADGQITAVGPFPELAGRFPGAEMVGDDHGVVLPGLVNAHTHLSEALLCGMGEDLTLYEWGERLVAPAGRHLTREMARVGALLKGAELLLSGATCVSDMFCHTNLGSEASLGAVDGLEELGLRGVVAFGPEDMAGPDRHPIGELLGGHGAV